MKKQVFVTPFKVEMDYVFDKNNNLVFQFDMDSNVDDATQQQMINKINTGQGSIYQLSKEGTILFDSNKNPIIEIRGWGYLTGVGGLNLPEKEADKVQEETTNFIFNRLTN